MGCQKSVSVWSQVLEWEKQFFNCASEKNYGEFQKTEVCSKAQYKNRC